MTTTPPVPSRWQADALAKQPLKWRLLARMFGIRVRPEDPDVLRLRAGLNRADPVADAFVAWSAEQPTGRGRMLFERVLNEGLSAVPEAPETLAHWFGPLETEPSWLDKKALALACRTSFRVGAPGGLVLSSTALMGGYRSAAAVKPLAMTGAMDKMVVRRLAETTRFLFDVLDSGDMGRFTEGFKASCRVRLMHAMVRRSLRRRKDWNQAAWGIPINQADMAATQLEFSAVYLTGLILLGHRFTKRERDAIMHLWRYVGVVMGADDALLAKDFMDGLRQMYIQKLTNPPADQDSRDLARALHEVPAKVAVTDEQKAAARFEMRMRTAVSRLTLGGKAIDDIGLPKEPLTPLLAFLAAGRFSMDTLRRFMPHGEYVAAQSGRIMMKGIVAELCGDEAVRYEPYAQRKGPSAHPLKAV